MKNANPVSSAPRALLLALGCAAALAGCARTPGDDGLTAQKTVLDRFPIEVGAHVASLHLAVLDNEQERGLMQRPDLGGDEGMIFVNPKPKQLGIWMRNTPEPLDLGFLSTDGTIREVYQLLPYDERGVYSVASGIQFALEMPRGWFEAHGIRPGSKLDLGALAAALRARGFSPADFGLR